MSRRLTIPLVAGLILVTGFFLPWFGLGSWLGASGAGIVVDTFNALTGFAADHRTIALMQPLLAALVLVGGVAVVWTELAGRPTRPLQTCVAAVAPILLVLYAWQSGDIDVVRRLDIGAWLVLVASVALGVTGSGLLDQPWMRSATRGRGASVAFVLLFVVGVVAATTPAWSESRSDGEVLFALGDIGRRLEAGDPTPKEPTFIPDDVEEALGSDSTLTTTPVPGDVAPAESFTPAINADPSRVLVGSGAARSADPTNRRGTTTTTPGSAAAQPSPTQPGSGSATTQPGTTATTRAGSAPTTTRATTTTVPCPVGKPTTKIDSQRTVAHSAGDDYYEVEVKVTVNNKASESIDLFYAEFVVNGEDRGDDNPIIGLSGSLGAGKAKSFTGRVVIRTPGGAPPQLALNALGYRWSDTSDRGRCPT
ncbi:MAG: hypothetical protein QOF21_1266 [Actinomycetota bacterium]